MKQRGLGASDVTTFRAALEGPAIVVRNAVGVSPRYRDLPGTHLAIENRGETHRLQSIVSGGRYALLNT